MITTTEPTSKTIAFEDDKLIRAFHDAQVRVLEEYWKSHRTDLVVSLIPHYNRALKQSLERAWPGTRRRAS